jgi:hypothetical protein
LLFDFIVILKEIKNKGNKGFSIFDITFFLNVTGVRRIKKDKINSHYPIRLKAGFIGITEKGILFFSFFLLNWVTNNLTGDRSMFLVKLFEEKGFKFK